MKDLVEMSLFFGLIERGSRGKGRMSFSLEADNAGHGGGVRSIAVARFLSYF
jgi:hypothetical protein